MNCEDVSFCIGSLPELVDALEVEDDAQEVVDDDQEVVNDAQEVVDDDQEVVTDVQEVVDDANLVDHSEYLAVDHEEVVVAESMLAPSEEEVVNAELVVGHYSRVRCAHFVEVVYAEAPEENYNSQQVYVERSDSSQEEAVDEVPVQEEAVDQVPAQEEAVDQVPAHILLSFHRVQGVYQNWLSNMSHTVSLFQGRKCGFYQFLYI